MENDETSGEFADKAGDDTDGESSRLAELESLLRRVRDGNREAREELLNAAFPRLLDIAALRVFRRHGPGFQKNTDSVIQRTAIDIWKLLESGQLKEWTVAEFLGKLNPILTHNVVDLVRHEKSHFDRIKQKAAQRGPDELGELQMAADADLDALEICEKIHTLIGKLPEELQAPFEQRVFNDLTFREISQILKLPEATVRDRYRRATLRLKRALGDDFL